MFIPVNTPAANQHASHGVRTHIIINVVVPALNIGTIALALAVSLVIHPIDAITDKKERSGEKGPVKEVHPQQLEQCSYHNTCVSSYLNPLAFNARAMGS